ncbi:extracellular solute-binding protein [Ktedonospora formicarum]|uniref:Carbohydrate-binding protein n=1 Tax=Ktedonospora formicarum TaxID=2778364 RepID=A0A8J3MRW9_9CHLR|nr:extracellular solute-binding protein [Ktedonospora formicarum]GHO42725.1 carbohydrate-binding protein [Ktedonospora formicarum]
MVSEQRLFSPDSEPVQSGHFTRRDFLGRAAALGLGATALASILSSCGTTALGAGKTHLTYWHLLGGGDGERMLEMVQKYQQANQDVDLEAVTLSWGTPYYTKLAMAAAGGRPPDVAILHMSRLPMYAGSGLLEPFDLSALASNNISQENFVAPVWQKAHYNNQLYAVPLDTHPLVMYYNIDVCQKAGLLDSTGKLLPFQGEDDVLNAFREAKKASGNLGISFPVGDPSSCWRVFCALYGQLDGPYFSADGKDFILDEDKATRVLDFLLRMSKEVGSTTADYAGSVALFSSGKAGFHWNGEWEVTTYQTQKTNFDMTLYPNIFGGQQTWADSHALVLPRQNAVDSQRRALSIKFISELLKNSQIWAQGGHIPTYLPVATSGEYQKLTPQSHYAEEAKHVVYDPSVWFAGAASEMETQAGAAFQAVIGGHLTPKQGVKQFRDAMIKQLKTPTPF